MGTLQSFGEVYVYSSQTNYSVIACIDGEIQIPDEPRERYGAMDWVVLCGHFGL